MFLESGSTAGKQSWSYETALVLSPKAVFLRLSHATLAATRWFSLLSVKPEFLAALSVTLLERMMTLIESSIEFIKRDVFAFSITFFKNLHTL
jgi:hypothetical protein